MKAQSNRRRGGWRGRRLVAVGVVLALATTAAACSSSGNNNAAGPTKTTTAPPSGNPAHPNVLFILTDDLDLGELGYLPNVKRLLGAQGATFTNYFASVSLCCPSRSTFLRGQYAHNTGVETNGGSNGGFETAHAKGIESSTIGTWMHDAGYQTAFIGKYLNGYPHTVSTTYIPPGWDEWDSASIPGNPYSEYNYTLNHNGRLERHGRTPADYGTTVYLNDATKFINASKAANKPWFVDLNVYAPHQPATPAPQDIGRFAGAKAPRTPSFNEADVSDKPQWVQSLPLLNQTAIRTIDRLYRRRIESLQAVDRAVGSLVDTLQATGQLANTYIIFTSDNGFHLGQHRMAAGKQTAYDTDIHLPLVVRGPGVKAGSTVGQLVGNVDLAPTIAGVAGAAVPSFVDGRSFAGLLHGSTAVGWRQGYLVEHWREQDQADRGGAALEPPDPDQGATVPAANDNGSATTTTTTAAPSSTVSARKGSKAGLLTGIPEFHGIRTAGFVYVEYSTGERELYDLTRDPDELHNLASGADPGLLARFHAELGTLVTCRAAGCRSAEAQPAPA